MCSFLERHGSFGREVKYLLAIVYGRFTLAIVMVKQPYTNLAGEATVSVKEASPFTYTVLVVRVYIT